MHDPHAQSRVEKAGVPLDEAAAAMVLLHGRGATAASILTLTAEFGQSQFAYRAPQAARSTWYPYSFMAPVSQNEPWLTSALSFVGNVLANLEAGGISQQRTMLLGFSQGACLALEYAARHAGRYGGIVAFSGGLIGPAGGLRTYEGDFQQTPVFLGCSDVDPHIPVERVHESKAILEGLNAAVEERIYPGMGHTVNQDEITAVKMLMEELVSAPRS